MRILKKSLLTAIFSICSLSFAQIAPFEVSQAKKASEKSSIEDLKAKLKGKKGEPSQDAYEMLQKLASAEEYIGEYDEAARQYAELSSLVSEGHINDPQKGPKYILRNARCALFAGDAKTSKAILEKILRSNDSNIDERTHAEARLLKVWCDIAEADGSYSKEANCISTLRYLRNLDETAPVRPAILYTLCWLTNDKDEKETLIEKFPDSPEAALMRGDATLMPTALWFLTARNRDPKVAAQSQEKSAIAKPNLDDYDDYEDYAEAKESVPPADAADDAATTVDTGITQEATEVAVVEAESPEVEPQKKDDENMFANPPKPSWVTSSEEQRGIVYTPMPTSPRPPEPPRDYSPEKTVASEKAATVETTPPAPPRQTPGKIAIVPAAPANPPAPPATSAPKDAPQSKAEEYNPKIIFLSPAKETRKQRYQQVGYYRDEENARRMAARLYNAGFEPVILARSPNGKEIFYAVAVPDQNNVAEIHLKEAGFDSFTIVE